MKPIFVVPMCLMTLACNPIVSNDERANTPTSQQRIATRMRSILAYAFLNLIPILTMSALLWIKRRCLLSLLRNMGN